MTAVLFSRALPRAARPPRVGLRRAPPVAGCPSRRPFSAAPSQQTGESNANPDDLSQSEFEERFHLGTQLSRANERVRGHQREWEGEARKFDDRAGRRWKDADPVGLQHCVTGGYEHTGLQDLHARSYEAPVLLEIRDVRVPTSSHHPSFTRLAKHRIHLICYTHADLIDASQRDRVERWTGATFPNAMCTFLDTRDSKDKKHLSNYVRAYEGLLGQLKGSNAALTVGIPNVGKSSVMTALLRLARERGEIPKAIKVRSSSVRNKKRGKKRQVSRGSFPDVSDTPGITRELTEYMLRDNPRSYFLDVPGITPPTFFLKERPEAWFGLGATNLVPLAPDGKRDDEMHAAFCDYVLSCANRDGIFHYVDKLKLPGPTDDVDEVLDSIHSRKYENLRGEVLRLKRCEAFLKLFNTGNLGPLVLDDMEDFSWKPFVFRDDHFNKGARDRLRSSLEGEDEEDERFD